jgi:hypothetical protein
VIIKEAGNKVFTWEFRKRKTLHPKKKIKEKDE